MEWLPNISKYITQVFRSPSSGLGKSRPWVIGRSRGRMRCCPHPWLFTLGKERKNEAWTTRSSAASSYWAEPAEVVQRLIMAPFGEEDWEEIDCEVIGEILYLIWAESSWGSLRRRPSTLSGKIHVEYDTIPTSASDKNKRMGRWVNVTCRSGHHYFYWKVSRKFMQTLNCRS